MQSLLSVLGVLFILAAVVGLIKPGLVYRWGEKRTRPRAFGLYFLLFMVVAVIGGATAEVEQAKKVESAKAEKKEEVARPAKAAAEERAVEPQEKKKSSGSWFGTADLDTLTDKAMAEEIKDIDGSIQEVRVNHLVDNELMALIFFVEKGGYSEASIMFSAAESMKTICQEIYEHNGAEALDKLLFFVKIPTTDQYGNEDKSMIMKVHFVSAKLGRVNWDNFTNWDLLNLVSDVERRPLGTKIIRAYCSKDDNAKYSTAFCRQYAWQ